MTNFFQPRLLHGVFGDPGLYVRLRWEGRAVLLDLGDLTTQPPGELLRVTDIFVSHTHIDHFIGFDHLLRIVLGRDLTIRLFGPPGIIANVEGKLAGYTWNLVEGYALTFDVYEVSREKILAARFPCGAHFERIDLSPAVPFIGVLIDDPLFRVEAVHLDHRVPCLAFAVVEAPRINIDPERLKRVGLDTGPWLTEFKRLIRTGAPGDTRVPAPGIGETDTVFREWRLADLRDQIVTITNGQRLVYVTDTLYSDENRRKIVALARDADLLFCEAMYLEQDREYAVERHHLTARQVGSLAREAGVKELVLFHFSPRYQECPEALYHEAAEAFGGLVR